MTEYWIHGHFKTADGKTATIRKEQGGSFELDGGNTPILFYYTNLGRKGHPLYVVTLPENGFKVCEANKLKDAKARTAELLPLIFTKCGMEDWKRQARSFQDLCKRAEELGVAML